MSRNPRCYVEEDFFQFLHCDASFNALFGAGEPPTTIPKWYTDDSFRTIVGDQINTFLTVEGIAGTHTSEEFQSLVPYKHSDPGQRTTFIQYSGFLQTVGQTSSGSWFYEPLGNLRRDEGVAPISFVRPDIGFAGNRRRRRQVSAA